MAPKIRLKSLGPNHVVPIKKGIMWPKLKLPGASAIKSVKVKFNAPSHIKEFKLKTK